MKTNLRKVLDFLVPLAIMVGGWMLFMYITEWRF